MPQIKKIAAGLLIAFAGVSSIVAHAETKLAPAAPTITPTKAMSKAAAIFLIWGIKFSIR